MVLSYPSPRRRLQQDLWGLDPGSAEGAEEQAHLVKLMYRFGLAVPLDRRSHDDAQHKGDGKAGGQGAVGAGISQYLVPALLPLTPPRELDDWTDKGYRSFFVVFTTDEKLRSEADYVSKTDLQQRGFLPDGLFERVLGKAASWCMQTSSQGYRDFVLYKDKVRFFSLCKYAVLQARPAFSLLTSTYTLARRRSCTSGRSASACSCAGTCTASAWTWRARTR